MLALRRRQQDQREGPPPPGHNNPPPEDEPDLYEVLDSVRDVEAALAQPNRETQADLQVLERADGRFSRFLAWLRDLAKKTPTLLVQGAITGLGGWAVKYALDHQAQIMEVLHAAMQTISNCA